MKMPRKAAFDVTVSKVGFVAKTQHIRSVVAGGGAAGMAGNVVAGGLIGMAIDGTNGSMNDLTPNPLAVVLEAAVEPAAVAAPAVAASSSAPPAPAPTVPAPTSPVPAPKS
jgi:hypothetical protein